MGPQRVTRRLEPQLPMTIISYLMHFFINQILEWITCQSKGLHYILILFIFMAYVKKICIYIMPVVVNYCKPNAGVAPVTADVIDHHRFWHFGFLAIDTWISIDVVNYFQYKEVKRSKAICFYVGGITVHIHCLVPRLCQFSYSLSQYSLKKLWWSCHSVKHLLGHYIYHIILKCPHEHIIRIWVPCKGR